MNRKEKRVYWRGVLDRYSKYTGSVKTFCEWEGVSECTFYYWRHKIGEDRGVSARGFVELRSTGGAAPGSVTVRLAGRGVELELPDNWTAAQMAALINALI